MPVVGSSLLVKDESIHVLVRLSPVRVVSVEIHVGKSLDDLDSKLLNRTWPASEDMAHHLALSNPRWRVLGSRFGVD